MLSHYSKHAISEFSNGLQPPDNEHKPGGVWLSDDTQYGWHAFVLERLRSGASDWSDGKELLQYRYDFAIPPHQQNHILFLKTPEDLWWFTSKYSESNARNCEVGGMAGHGLHIEWHRVKTDFKGILITPFQQELSRQDPNFHWYRFDCASGCVWDVNCLTLLRE